MHIEPQTIQHAAQLLATGKLVGIPTETVYGLGACARTPDAIQKIYATKGRPATNPLIIHLSHWAAISEWAINIPDSAWVLAKHFWPGPLTLVLQRHPKVLDMVTAHQETVALRVPNHPVALALLQEFKGGIAAPSANRSGRISPTTAAHVYEELGDAVDYILDGGPCKVGIESTIVHCKDSNVQILRHGHITQKDLSIILDIPLPLENDLSLENSSKGILVPGSDKSHYAPSSPLFLLDPKALSDKISSLAAQHKRFSVIAFSRQPASIPQTNANIVWAQANEDPNIYANHLYAWLRQMDNMKPDCILVEKPPSTIEWRAIQDRLQRASYRK
jgi:L-threonylcarbamoyladenylate synthase